MPSPKKRVIIDTNLWISFLLTKNFLIFNAAAEGGFDIISSVELMDEFQRVALRPKFRKYFTLEKFEEFLFHLSSAVTSVEITNTVSTCRDPKDNFLLALALDSKATHLITGDKDLLVLKRFGETDILTLSEYLSIEKGR